MRELKEIAPEHVVVPQMRESELSLLAISRVLT
jgi:hypothetical protein